MAEFLAALAAFLAAHAIPARPAVRRRLVAALGERVYLAGYSLLSLALLGWLILAAVRAPHVGLWIPAPWTYLLAVIVMPFALALVGAGLAGANPLSVSFRRDGGESHQPGFAGLRHPVLWGFALWALAHIPPNGDLVSVVLFGALALFAFAGMAILDRRRRRELGEAEWRRLAADARRRPFGRPRRAPSPAVLGGAAAGLVVYVLLLFDGHRRLFGVDPLALL